VYLSVCIRGVPRHRDDGPVHRSAFLQEFTHARLVNRPVSTWSTALHTGDGHHHRQYF